MSRSRATLIAGVAVVLVAWIAFVQALSRSGFLAVSQKPEAQVVAAAIALVGAFLGTLVSLLGLILKFTLDEEAGARLEKESKRNAELKKRENRRLELEAERDAQAQKDAERRLALEAGIKAVQLLATSSGTPALPVQYSGALFTLASLGQHELTLSLTAFLLRQNALDPDTAASLINRAIKGGSEGETHTAITVLRSNLPKFFTATEDSFPECIMNWELGGSDDYLRSWSIVALAEAMVARSAAAWRGRLYNAYALLGAMGLAWQEERGKPLQADIGSVLRWSLVPFPKVGTLAHPCRSLDMEQIRSEVAASKAVTGAVIDAVERLEKWATGRGAGAQPSTIASS